MNTYIFWSYFFLMVKKLGLKDASQIKLYVKARMFVTTYIIYQNTI